MSNRSHNRDVSQGNWFFNTNETHASGAWENIIKQGVIAACGYGGGRTKAKMDLPARGDRIFAYVNRRGVTAVGEVTEETSEQGDGIFNRDTDGDEYHRQVTWLTEVPVEKAIGKAEVSVLGYNMPVRCTIGRWSDSKVAEQVADLLKSR